MGGQWKPIGEHLTLVDGTCVEMLRNKKPRKNNSSGVPGVDWQADKRRWRAAICFKGKRYYLGRYVYFDDAVAARRKAEEELHDAFLAEYNQSHKADEEESEDSGEGT